MTKKDAVWMGCGAVLLAGALWVGYGDEDAGQGRSLAPVEGKNGPRRDKPFASGGMERPGSGRERRPKTRTVSAESSPEAERLVREGKASPAQVAAVAKAAALVPQFRQVLQLPAGEAEGRTASLMDEVGGLPLLSEPLVNAVRDVLLTGDPQVVADYAITGLERQGTPQSAGLLADLLQHPNGDIRDAALTALEGMAGGAFDTPEAAGKWARSWCLTPEEQDERLEDMVPSVGLPASTPGTPPPGPSGTVEDP